MKKIITLLLILVLSLSLVLALASCGEEEEGPNNENDSNVPQGPGIGDPTGGWNGQDTPLVPLPDLE